MEVPDRAGSVSETATGIRPAWKAAAAYAVYQAITVVVWVLPAWSRFTHENMLAGRQDSRYFQWALAWTPWALLHHLNPLHDPFLFAPTGVNLAWSTFVPGPAIVMWPVTELFSPVTSLNLIKAAAPALAGWAAYLVCHRLTGRFWPSVVGGYLFGFSAYTQGSIPFVNLVLVFPIPLLVYVVVRRVEGSIGSVAFVAGFAALLVGLFSISTELFGTTAIFGAIAFGGALVVGREIRRELLGTLRLIALAGAIAAVALLPYLVAVVSTAPSEPLHGSPFAMPPWGFVIPSAWMALGGDRFLAFTQRLTLHPNGSGLGYLGLALLALLGFAITERRRAATWALLGFVAFVSIVALGPTLTVGGRSFGLMPQRLMLRAPFMSSAVPARFTLYSALAVGVIVALWLARAAGRWAWVRWAVAVAACLSLFPARPNTPPPQQVPAFISSSELPQVLGDHENVFAIGIQRGDEMLWQATAGFRFDLAQGYIGVVPRELWTGQLSRGLSLLRSKPPPADAFRAWLEQHEVSAVLLADQARPVYGSMLSDAGLEPVFSGGGASVWRWEQVP